MQALVRSDLMALVRREAVAAALYEMMVFLARSGMLNARSAAVTNVFLAVDWPDMRRVAVEVGPADAEILAVRIDPFPQLFA
jgi:hypothetical protein